MLFFARFSPKYSHRLLVVGVFASVAFGSDSHAIDLKTKRAMILKEVMETIDDVELAKQIVEIRIRREILNPQPRRTEIRSAVEEPAKIIETPSIEPSIQTEQINKSIIENARSNASTPTPTPTPTPTSQVLQHSVIEATSSKNGLYAGIGTRVYLGYAYKYETDYSFRLEISGIKKSDSNKQLNGTGYQLSANNLSIGSYIDWYPISQSSLRMTGGVNINRMRTLLTTANGQSLNINGNPISLGTDIFNVEFKFPTVTPYIGIRYETKNENDVGLHFYGEFGLMLGKYDATVATSLISSQKTKNSDMGSELNILRKSLYKWAFVPTAHIGLSYKFN